MPRIVWQRLYHPYELVDGVRIHAVTGEGAAGAIGEVFGDEPQIDLFGGAYDLDYLLEVLGHLRIEAGDEGGIVYLGQVRGLDKPVAAFLTPEGSIGVLASLEIEEEEGENHDE